MTRRTPLGAELVTEPEAGVSFRVWAPPWERVTVVIEGDREIALAREADGEHWTGFAPELAAGARYRVRLGADPQLHADPASRYQPDGPSGPSVVVDPRAFRWTDGAWRGVEAHVVYELHLGTFTRAGTWAAAAQHLPYLAELGVTTLEVMPVHEFAGAHGWGYDGVNLFAPHARYGTPDDFRAFVDRAHALGLGVILDVVYNHFGPSGNSLFTFAPSYRHRERANDWGDALNFDGEQNAGVREFFLANAAQWIGEYHLDGLRLDATQAIHDSSTPHILAQLGAAARAAAGDRRIWLVAENEPQDAALVRDHGIDAMWNDDFHHTARVAATGSVDGYLHDYAGSAQELLSAVKHGFLFQGQRYAWQQQPRGTPARGLAPTTFVHFLENHDQVANFGGGDRLATLAQPGVLRALAALVCLTPPIPMLFQGQETGARAPWTFFADHGGELGRLVREGRAKFMTQFDTLASPEAQAALPDPTAAATFAACILDEAERDFARPVPRFYKDLLTLRREVVGADLDGAVLGPRALAIRYPARLLIVNLGPTIARGSLAEPLVAPLPGTGWRTRWSSEDPAHGGAGTAPVFAAVGVRIPAHAAVLLEPGDEPAVHGPGPNPPPSRGDA
ncbi:MAG TPA: malto-oligosyltrehalose trehalohydrolase [Kofleriaceae bacterium]